MHSQKHSSNFKKYYFRHDLLATVSSGITLLARLCMTLILMRSNIGYLKEYKNQIREIKNSDRLYGEREFSSIGNALKRNVVLLKSPHAKALEDMLLNRNYSAA